MCLNLDLLQERKETTAVREARYKTKMEQYYNKKVHLERKETTAVREARYKTKMEQYYNKKVHLVCFRPGEFVFRRNKASRVEDQGKLGPK
nr:reverse transcriptase domain-containing protein [Tanacetum cinerariifolium]